MSLDRNIKFIAILGISYLLVLPALFDIVLEPLYTILSVVFFFVQPNSPDDLLMPHLIILLCVSVVLSIFKPKGINRLIPVTFALLTLATFNFWMTLALS